MKRVALISFFIMINIIIACKVECPPDRPYFTIAGFLVTNQERIMGSNGWVSQIAQSHTDTLNQDLHFVIIRTAGDYVANTTYNSGGTLMARNDCEVQLGTAGSKHGLKNIHIITLNDFNATYQANDTITDIAVFEMHDYKKKDFDAYMTINEFLSDNATSMASDNFAFKITESIANEYQEVQYKIVLELTNGDLFEGFNSPMKLKK